MPVNKQPPDAAAPDVELSLLTPQATPMPRTAKGKATMNQLKVAGREVKVIVEDSDPEHTGALTKVRRLVEQEKVNTIAGGLLAATGAGLTCLVTVNGYTRDERFDEAVLVVSELGDPGGPPIEVLAARGAARPHDLVTLDDLRACLAAPAPAPAAPAGRVQDPEEGGAA